MGSIKICPVCNGELEIRELVCKDCGLKISGRIPMYHSELSEKEWEIVKMFVLCDGSFKCMSEKLDVSYPTIKKIIENVKSKLGGESYTKEVHIDDILNRIETGELSVKDGIEEIKRRKK